MTLESWVEKVSGTGVGERTRSFLHGLSWFLPAAVLGKGLTSGASLLAARVMGPAEFGRVNLALTAGLWIQIPMFFGLHVAMMRFVARAPARERPAWIRLSLLSLAATGTAAALAAAAGARIWAAWLQIPEELFLWGLAWTAGFFLFTVGTSLLAALELFKARAFGELGFSVLYPLGIVLLWRAGRLGHAGYLSVMALPYALTGLAALALGWRAVLGGGVKDGAGAGARAGEFWGYSALASLGSVSFALLFSANRLLLNRFLSVEAVGVFSVYLNGSVNLAGLLMVYFTQVFFPIAARAPDRAAVLRKLGRLMLPVLSLGCLVFGAFMLAYFQLLGRKYPLEAGPWLAFTLAAGLSLLHQVLGWNLAAQGARGVLATGLMGLATGALNALLCWAWVPGHGVAGAGWALAASYAGGVALCWTPVFRRAAGGA